MSVKISVILPVYNVGMWISETIESLKAQTFLDWEAIFVIDGSTDDSENIVRMHMDTDSRIKTLRQSNKGQGAARDYGVEQAKGEYIFFLDPDDLLPPSGLSNAYNRAISTGADIIVGDYIAFYDGSNVKLLDKPAGENFHRHFAKYGDKLFYRNDITDVHFFYHGLYFMVVWMKLFKRDTWLKNAIKSPSGLTMGEDFMTVKKMLFLNSSVSMLDSVLVYYRKRSNSATTQRSEKSFGIFESFKFTRSMYHELGLDDLEVSYMRSAYLTWFYTHLTKYTPYNEMFSFYMKIRENRDDFLTFDADLGLLGPREILALKCTVLPGIFGFVAYLAIMGSKDLIKLPVIWCVSLLSSLLPISLHRKFEGFLTRTVARLENRKALKGMATQVLLHFRK